MSETLVLIPGMLNNASLWNAVAPKLADNASIITPEFAGEESIAAMAESVLAHASPGPLAIAGFSMGGWVAQEIVHRAPDRVSRLAFISAGSGAADERERNAYSRTSNSVVFDFEASLTKMFPVAVHPARHGDAALRTAAVGMWRAVGNDTFQRQRRAVIERADLRPVLRAIHRSVPALVACGDNDQVLPPALSRELAALMPHARLVLVEDCGHMLPLERPDELVTLLRDWLQISV